MLSKGPFITLPLFLLAILVLVGYRYQQDVLAQQFMVTAVAPCDSLAHNCFVADCTAGEAGCDKTPYEKVTLPARSAPACLLGNSCTAFTCVASDACAATYCSSSALEDGEVCTSPNVSSSP